MAHASGVIATAAIVLAACALGPTPPPIPAQQTPTSAPPTATASATATLEPSPTPEPTPDLAAVPRFAAGEIVATTTDGLRVRRLPGTTHAISVERLPTGAELAVVTGPVFADGFGWYLVADADAAAPAFDDGWIAAGYLPEAFLAATGDPRDPRYVAGFAETGDAAFGPVSIGDEHYSLRWLALDPEGVRCSFAVSLATATSGDIPTARATVSDAPIPGQLFSPFFVDNPSLRGQVFVDVTSDCAWALAFVRTPPAPTPAP